MQCAFCNNELKPGTGMMIVSTDGRVTYYCSSKCKKNAMLKRSPRKVRWTKQYAEEKKIRIRSEEENKK